MIRANGFWLGTYRGFCVTALRDVPGYVRVPSPLLLTCRARARVCVCVSVPSLFMLASCQASRCGAALVCVCERVCVSVCGR